MDRVPQGRGQVGMPFVLSVCMLIWRAGRGHACRVGVGRVPVDLRENANLPAAGSDLLVRRGRAIAPPVRSEADRISGIPASS